MKELISPNTDTQLITMWLHGQSLHTKRAYSRDVKAFLDFVQKPLMHVTLMDLQAFADSLDSLAPSSKHRTISSIKSLFSFAAKTGFLSVNIVDPGI